MNKPVSYILLRQLFWTFLISSGSSFIIQTIFFGIHVNEWFTIEDVMTLNILALFLNICLALTSLTTLLNLSSKIGKNKKYFVLSYFLVPLLFTILTFVAIVSLKPKDIYPLDFLTVYISYSIAIALFFVSYSYSFLKFKRSIQANF